MSTDQTTETTPAKKETKTLRSDLKPVWCPGCGDFGVIAGLDQALVELGYKTHEVVFAAQQCYETGQPVRLPQL